MHLSCALFRAFVGKFHTSTVPLRSGTFERIDVLVKIDASNEESSKLQVKSRHRAKPCWQPNGVYTDWFPSICLYHEKANYMGCMISFKNIFPISSMMQFATSFSDFVHCTSVHSPPKGLVFPQLSFTWVGAHFRFIRSPDGEQRTIWIFITRTTRK